MPMQYSRIGLNYERKSKKKEIIRKGKMKIDWMNVMLGIGLVIIIIFYFVLK